MSGPEPSYLLKFQRALKHMQELNSAIEGWVTDPDHYESFFDPNPDSTDELFLKVTAKEPLRAYPISLILGDVIQDFRSSLEHLAFALALAHTKPMTDEIARNSQFPIVGDVNSKGVAGSGEVMFDSQRAKLIGAIHPDAQAIIKFFQPYQSGAPFREHPLWWLSELPNIDKHRLVHVVVTSIDGIDFFPERSNEWQQPESGAVGFYPWRAITRETVVARIRRSAFFREGKMDVKIRPSLTIALPGEPAQSVSDVLGDIRRTIETIFGQAGGQAGYLKVIHANNYRLQSAVSSSILLP